VEILEDREHSDAGDNFQLATNKKKVRKQKKTEKLRKKYIQHQIKGWLFHRKGKAKVKWNFEGDMNTNFFHKTKKSNGPTKLITSIIDGNDVIIDLAAIFDHVLHNFTNLCSCNNFFINNGLIKEVIPNLVN